MVKRRPKLIPNNILLPPLKRMTKEAGCCCDNFRDGDTEVIRYECGPLYAGVPLDDVKRLCINLRKQNLVGPINGGQGPRIGSRTKRPFSKQRCIEIAERIWLDQDMGGKVLDNLVVNEISDVLFKAYG